MRSGCRAFVDPDLLEEFKMIRGLFRGLSECRVFVGDMRPWSGVVV